MREFATPGGLTAAGDGGPLPAEADRTVVLRVRLSLVFDSLLIVRVEAALMRHEVKRILLPEDHEIRKLRWDNPSLEKWIEAFNT